jgi:hypothetical protein
MQKPGCQLPFFPPAFSWLAAVLAQLIPALLLSSFLSPAYADEAAGMVLDLRGSGQLIEQGKSTPLQLLAYLKPGMQVKLDAGAQASLSLYTNRSVYQLQGPSLIEVTKDKLVVLQGQPPLTKRLGEKLVLAAQAGNEVSGAFRMRSLVPRIVLSHPASQSRLSNLLPRFCWSMQQPAPVELILEESPDIPLIQIKTEQACWQLPADKALSYGKAYHWSVSSVDSKNGRNYSAEGDFQVLSKENMEQFAALRPAANAAIEEWILYAATLQQHHVHDDAQAAWQYIAGQRPDLEKAQELAK